MTTKNLGQVAGVFIGTTPPENITLIWYDSTPNQMLHKVYDVNLAQWVVLDKNTISSITYSELVNLATTVGLSIGAWFKITDRGNSLALAITSTKVQYDDALGNILIDDLGTNVQYHVTSSNLSIDDVIGVFDVVNKKLVFQFNEQTPDYTADDYILGKVKRNNIWSLAKYKLSSFLSKVTGNSITWNGGFFFNFNNAIHNILDQSGGVVAKDTYDIDLQNLNAAINNVGEENQSIIESTNQAITNATSDAAIYDKKIPSVDTSGAPINVAAGDKLITIISKLQKWVNQFKTATGIRISQTFVKAPGGQSINNNDTVESAFGKVQGNLDKILEEDIPDVIKRGFYDYIVDSDDSLAGLINNPDAHTVLIKNGTWNYDFGNSVEDIIQLHSNTKIIHCQPNAVINITGSVSLRDNNSIQSVITYNPLTNDDKIKEIRGLNVKITLRDSLMQGVSCFIYCFNNLDNLYDCNILSFESRSIIRNGYVNCRNLFDCNSFADVYQCYLSCKNLKRCTGNASYCFYQCENLEECYFEGTRTKLFLAFAHCKNLDRCWSKIKCESNTATNFGAFYGCDRLINCSVSMFKSILFSVVPFCFDLCSQVHNCYVFANEGGGEVNGISNSKMVIGCFVNYTISTKYVNSYSTYQVIPENVCADTAEGGFNA